jgi:hypothetical protein
LLASRSTLKSTKQRVTIITRDAGTTPSKRRSLPTNLQPRQVSNAVKSFFVADAIAK